MSAVSPRLAALGGPSRPSLLEPGERKIRLHKAMVGVIGRFALVRPLILVIEDLQWADSPTLELLWDLARTLLVPRPQRVGSRVSTRSPALQPRSTRPAGRFAAARRDGR